MGNSNCFKVNSTVRLVKQFLDWRLRYLVSALDVSENMDMAKFGNVCSNSNAEEFDSRITGDIGLGLGRVGQLGRGID